MADEPELDGDEDLDDEESDVAEEPEEKPGHPLTARDAYPFLPKIIG
jgi:hypothetical protein